MGESTAESKGCTGKPDPEVTVKTLLFKLGVVTMGERDVHRFKDILKVISMDLMMGLYPYKGIRCQG